MSAGAAIGGGIMGGCISLCCPGFSKGTVMSTHFFFYNTNLKFLKGKSECGALVGWGGLRGRHNQRLEVAQPLLGWNPA